MTTINPYLHFNGRSKEAMNFYKECFGGELTMQTVEGSPMESQCPGAMKHYVLHSMLKKNGLVLMASDMPGKEGPAGYATNISLSINCSSKDEVDNFFTNLSNEGRIVEPLKDQFWGARWGCVKDKYGINWMLNYDKSQNI